MPENIVLVTSICPHDLENQQRAVGSWLRLGLSVFSLNAQSEIDTLRPYFDNVEFVAVQENACAGGEKSKISLNDVTGFLGAHGSPVCGVIKPDIHLRASPGALRFLMDEAKGSLVYASRTDVASLDDAAGVICKSSFDAFLFDRMILKSLPSTDLCLGRPWWDLWLPYCLMRSPYTLKFASFPFASHPMSAQRGQDGDDYEKYGLLFARFLDQDAHNALSVQAPEVLGKALEAMQLNVAMAILFESRWLSCFPE